MVKRAVATAAGALLLGLVLWPLSWPQTRDSFPLSPYPMFSIGRHSRLMTIEHVHAVTADGERMLVPAHVIADTNALHVAMMVSAAAANPERSAELCDEIARKLPGRADRLGRAAVVEISASTFDGVAYFTGDRAAHRRELRASCQVPQ